MSNCDNTKRDRDTSGKPSKSAVSARAAAGCRAFATRSAAQTASPTTTASSPHAPPRSRWPLRPERSADSGQDAVADFAVRDAIVRGRNLEPGTLFRCSLTDDGDTVHRIAAIGCSLYDIRFGLEVEREEIVVDTIHDAGTAVVNTLSGFANEGTIEHGRGA